MANSSIYKKIEERGALEANKIYEDGLMRINQYKENRINEANTEIDQIMKKYLERKEDQLKTKSTEIEQSAKQRSLAVKKEIINDIFDKALQKLVMLDDESLVELVVRLLKQENLSGDELIQVSKKDYDRYKRLFSIGRVKDGYVILDKLAMYLSNEKFQLLLDNKAINIAGGFNVIGKKYDVNQSFETILQSIKEKEESNIASLLFGEE